MNTKLKKDFFVVVIILLILFVLSLLLYAISKLVKHNPTKDYPVRVVLYGELHHSTFDCDSVTNEGTFQYAWKDSVRIPLDNVFEIKFN